MPSRFIYTITHHARPQIQAIIFLIISMSKITLSSPFSFFREAQFFQFPQSPYQKHHQLLIFIFNPLKFLKRKRFLLFCPYYVLYQIVSIYNNNKSWLKGFFQCKKQKEKVQNKIFILALEINNRAQFTVFIDIIPAYKYKKSILIKLIQLMDKIMESRMNRSLMIHGLENLVFEKRQRKLVEQQPQTLPTILHEKKSNKKTKKTVSKKSVTLPNRLSKINLQNSQRLLKNKKIRHIKKIQKQQKHIEESQPQQQSCQYEQESQKVQAISKKIQNPSMVKKKPSLQLKQQVMVRTSTENENELKQKNKDEQPSGLANASSGKRGRGRPKKDHSESAQNVQPESVKNEEKPQLQETITLKSNQLIIPQQPIKCQTKLEKASEEEKDAVCLLDKVNTRQRRAKAYPFKSYNEDDDQLGSNQSFQNDRPSKKKKKISKSSRSKNGNKPYSLNRIFRKQAKRHFSTFTLDLNFNKISLTSFIKQFGTFDLIHFSLPISYLYLFPQVASLIQKGFIFVWVERGQTQIGYHLLNRWGFDIIDQIIWVKANEDQNKIQADNVDICNSIFDSKQEQTISNKQLFINSKSTCLVGYKCPLGNRAEYRTKVSNNIIFSKSLEGLKKPAQIYEIADLMMPGAKKLEFGNDCQKGWLNLKHNQQTLYRCNTCLKQQNLYFLIDSIQKPVKCKRCIINDIKVEYQNESVEEITRQYQALNKVQIKTLMYLDKLRQICQLCRRETQKIQVQGLFKVDSNNSQVCIDCFRSIVSKQKIQQVNVLVQKRRVFFQNQLICSDCGVSSICDIYFECNKCKNHIVCKNCFWKVKQNIQTINLGEQQQRKPSRKQVIHEWRLKFIKSSPQMKFTCFGCKSDLSIPFWCCQTCQNWFWCGRCDKGKRDIHPHYQTDEHVEYIMI